jgi:hypothetical protein
VRSSLFLARRIAVGVLQDKTLDALVAFPVQRPGATIAALVFGVINGQLSISKPRLDEKRVAMTAADKGKLAGKTVDSIPTLKEGGGFP